MNRIKKSLAFVALATVASVSLVFAQGPPPGAAKKGPAGPGLTLTTTAFADGAEIPAKYTQSDPMAVSPKLDWTNVPDGVQSFVLHLHDPDVAIGPQFEDVLHWMAFNIPGEARSLPEGVPANATLPDGTMQILNRGNKVGFMGPGAPAAGPHHHYTFELYALDAKLTLPPTATRAEVLKAMEGHVRAKAVLVGRFHR